MFNIFKSDKNKEKKAGGVFSSLSRGLKKTRTSLMGGLANLILGKKAIDDSILEEIETQLILADVGVEVTQEIIQNLTQKISRKELNDSSVLFATLKNELKAILAPISDKQLQIEDQRSPLVFLMVGVNGTGKTTSIGKLAHNIQARDKKILLAAGDTFRAAAIEQIQIWGERNNIPVIAQHSGADSASVIFDAFQAAKARNMDILIADTAGRLHTQSNLMEELKKIKRVLAKQDESAPHETLLVVDATTGQNALRQAEQFNNAVGLTGLIITKLDGTAKGGILFAIAKKTQLPIYFIGVGEKIDDLLPFDANKFVEALFGD